MSVLYWIAPTPAEIARDWGDIKTVEDFPEPDCDIWEENWDAIMLYDRFSDQWRTGPGGFVGLDLTVFQNDMALRGVPTDEQLTILDKLRTITKAARHEITSN